MSKALTNNEFITKLNLLITKLGGTPTTDSLDDDKLDDMLSNDVFVAKLNEVITAMGGTPTNTQMGRDENDDMVSESIFSGKLDEVIANAGSGGSSDFSTAEVTFAFAVTGSENYVGIGNDENGNLVFFADGEWNLVRGGDNYTVNIPIPTGKATKLGMNILDTRDYSIARVELSGGVTHDENYLIISGDGIMAVYDI